MKRIAFLMAALLMTGAIAAQETKVSETGRDAKQVKKEIRDKELEKQYQANLDLINRKSFVLEADNLGNQYGTRYPVSSSLNFIMVDSARAVLQVGSNGRIGPNGVGGVTAEGNLSGWKMTTDDKNMYVNLHFTVMTLLGIYDVALEVSASGNATATLSGTTAGRLNFYGNLVPLEESKVYQGQASHR